MMPFVYFFAAYGFFVIAALLYNAMRGYWDGKRAGKHEARSRAMEAHVERIKAEWQENEDRRWSERCKPYIAKVIEDSRQGVERWT